MHQQAPKDSADLFAGQIGANTGTNPVRGGLDGVVGNPGQANDRGRKHHPIDGGGAVFVAAEPGGECAAGARAV